MKPSKLKLILMAFMACSVFLSKAQESSKPNIVFILADDFGYTSLNCYGADKSLVRTPNIDRIAEKGMSFSQCLYSCLGLYTHPL